MGILFESHDNDFTECLELVVGWFAMRLPSTDEHLLKWLDTNDGVDTLSEAFAAAVYARDCSDVSMEIDIGGERTIQCATIEERRAYLGKLKISINVEIPADGCNGEAVFWDGEEIRIV